MNPELRTDWTPDRVQELDDLQELLDDLRAHGYVTATRLTSPVLSEHRASFIQFISNLKTHERPTFTIDDIMDALNDAFQKSGSPTSRDCRVAENLRDILAHRTRADSSAGSECETRVASDEANGG